MITPQFVPGQRWISATESELGLGIVKENLGRRVIVTFPAAQEERIYAVDNAPLSRVEYAVGEQIATLDGRTMVVTERLETEGRLSYVGLDESGERAEIDELDLDSFVQFGKPQDRLFAGQIDKNSFFELRADTLTHAHAHHCSPAFGLLGGRVALLAHQLYIASEVASRRNPRVLLADEVGLGKTIEAGLVLHQRLISARADRAIIIVPDSLVHQWLVEMLRRFNLRFTIIDSARVEALEETEPCNPFETAQLILCTLSFLVENPDRHAQAIEAGFDMMIVDEAHYLSFDPKTGPSPAYACIEALAAAVPSLLLLSATPEQLGVAGHFARLRLLDKDRYHDLDVFRSEEEGFRPLSDLLDVLLESDSAKDLRANTDVMERVGSLLGSAAAAELEEALSGSAAEVSAAVNDTVDRLLDRHGTGRVLFRNTREAVGGFAKRVLTHHPVTAPVEYMQACDSAHVESLLRPEALLGEDWVTLDSRVRWLADWLRELGDKALVICAQASTAAAIEEHLRTREGLRVAVFHEGLTLVARDRAAAYFADTEDDAQALICSEIGSEGRNFQFAHHVVLLDLPLNPDLLEQRIGRLDRIGQRHDVCIHVPFYAASAMAVLARWYDEGLNAFCEPLSAGDVLFSEFEDALTACLHDPEDDDGLAQLIAASKIRSQAVRDSLSAGRNRLLELNSCRPGRAAEVLQGIATAARSDELSDYMERVFDHFGVEQQSHGPSSVVLRPGDHMICESFPGLAEDGITATYRRTEALAREDLHFLTWEHPTVLGGMDMLLSGEFGNTAVCTLSLPVFKPGTLLIEAYFAVHCPGPKALALRSYLPEGALRMVVDRTGNDLAAALSEDRLRELAKRVARRTAHELVRRARAPITEMVAHAQTRADAMLGDFVSRALEKMHHQTDLEVERLTSLAQVNPAIDADDIAHAREMAPILAQHLEASQFKVDALRVVLAT